MKENRSFIGVVVVALVIGLVAYLVALRGDFVVGRGMGQHQGDFAIYYIIKAVLSSVNVFLLVVLSSIYFRVYKDTGLEFSFGLVVFSAKC